jgi:hypothetical protein
MLGTKMALVAFQQKKSISVHCRQIGHKLQATRASSPFSIAQQHRRAHRHPAISRFVARRCGHAALLSHSCLGVCERCCSLIFFASCSFHISPTQHSLAVSPMHSLSLSLHTGGTAASLAGATRRARPWGRGQRGVGRPRLAAPWWGGAGGEAA